MGLGAYRDAKIADLLEHAAIILTERGFTKGATINPATGEVDARGALLLAGGAKPAKILGFDGPEAAGIPEYWQPKVDAAIEVIEFINGDLEEWCDHPDTTIETVIAAFRRAKHLIQIAVT